MIDPITGLPSSNIQNKDGTISYASPIIDATKVGTTPVITVPPPVTVPDTTYTSAINSVGASAQASQDAIQAEQEAQAKLAQSQGVSSDISKLESQLGGKAADTANLYSTAGGVNDAYKQLKDLNAQAIGLKNEASAIPIQTPLAYQGTAATQQTIASVNRDKLSQNALKALSLGQQAAIAQGNFDVAKSLADQQIEVKYSQMEADLKSKQTQLAALDKYVLTPAQEKAKSALERQYKLQDQEIADKKAQEKEINDLLLNASQVAPKDVYAKAQQVQVQGGTPVQVAQALGQYGKDYLKNEMLKEQLKTEKAQQGLIYANTAKVKYDMTPQVDTNGNQISTKPPTQEQVTNAGYAERIRQANSVIDNNARTFQKMTYKDFVLANSKNQVANSLMKPEVRQVAQAMRNFITAKLRKESGASIAPSEFQDAQLQYFPALGDDATTLANKKALRDSVLQNQIIGSGSAYKGSPEDSYLDSVVSPSMQKVEQKTTPVSLYTSRLLGLPGVK